MTDAEAIQESVCEEDSCHHKHDGWICTRPPSHSGEHIAVARGRDCVVAMDDEVCARWPNVSKAALEWAKETDRWIWRASSDRYAVVRPDSGEWFWTTQDSRDTTFVTLHGWRPTEAEAKAAAEAAIAALSAITIP